MFYYFVEKMYASYILLFEQKMFEIIVPKEVETKLFVQKNVVLLEWMFFFTLGFPPNNNSCICFVLGLIYIEKMLVSSLCIFHIYWAK